MDDTPRSGSDTSPLAPSAPMAPAPQRWDLFRNRGFGLFVVSIFLNNLATQIQTVAVGWLVYDLTRNPFDLGLVGLLQFAPALVLVLVTGSVADRFSRRAVMSLCLALMALSSAGILLSTVMGNTSIGLILVLISLFGVARAFYVPVRQAIVSNLVPRDQMARALALNGSVNQFAVVAGPAAGGLLYAVSGQAAFVVAFVAMASASVLVALIPRLEQRRATARQSWPEIIAGFSYIRTNPVLLGAVTLDLFVVFLGGALAMLPVYARDILDVGAVGLGALRSAPAVGAVLVGAWMLRAPIQRHAGLMLFVSVGIFCLATLVFALSTVVWVSVLALVVVGASDMVSVVVRSTIVQLHTPDELRGRVNAVNQVFIGASNEVGGFRAGTTAALVGPVPAVAGGAVLALGLCVLWARIFPQLRDIQDLTADPRARP